MMRPSFAPEIFMSSLSIDWPLYMGFGIVLLTASLTAVRLARAMAEKRREARWDRGLPAK
jgi:hypothetical protein